ncbi:MAG: hypothetical protein PHW96_04350 [Candidatus Nanoarchaeia archaeon]|nr:hypothetical protein [Candidatus Nanoarchaeia archaeon]
MVKPLENIAEIVEEISSKKEIFMRTLFVMLAQDTSNSLTVKGVDFNISNLIMVKGGSFTVSTSTKRIKDAAPVKTSVRKKSAKTSELLYNDT